MVARLGPVACVAVLVVCLAAVLVACLVVLVACLVVLVACLAILIACKTSNLDPVLLPQPQNINTERTPTGL